MNNVIDLSRASDIVTMSSLEIAEIADKNHRDVMRDIRLMLSKLYGEGGVRKFAHTHRNQQNGQEYPVYKLPRRECFILITGYNIPLRAKIIDRWEELERGIAKPDPDAFNVTIKEMIDLVDCRMRISGEAAANELWAHLGLPVPTPQPPKHEPVGGVPGRQSYELKRLGASQVKYPAHIWENRVIDALSDLGGWVAHTQLKNFSRVYYTDRFHRAVDALLDRGIIEKTVRHPEGYGRPATLYRLVSRSVIGASQ